MNRVQAVDHSAQVGAVHHEDAAPTHAEANLVAPDAPRQGGLPAKKSGGWSPFGGRIFTTVAAATLAATALPFMAGCGLADSHQPSEVVEVHEAAPVAEPTTVRGQVVQAPVPGGGADGIWLVPPGRAETFEIDGQSYERLYVGVAGSEATEGLHPGGFADVTGSISGKVVGDLFVPVVDGIDEVVRGLPRDLTGDVFRGAAPGAEGGAEATDLFLTLGARVWMHGPPLEPGTIVHLGAEDTPALEGVNPGDQLQLGGRIDLGPEGPYVASIETLTAQPYAGSDVQPPTFDGTQFLAADGTTALPSIDLGSHDGRRQVVVVDDELGVAHLGSVGRAAGSQDFTATFEVQAFLQGGPTFDVDRGRVVDDDGYKLSPQSTWVEHGAEGDTHNGWYLHESSDTLYRLTFTIDAEGDSDPARVTHAIAMGDHE